MIKTLVFFGNGSLQTDIVTFNDEYKYAMLLKEIPKQEVGTEIEKPDTNVNNYQVQMLFKDITDIERLRDNLIYMIDTVKEE